MAEVVLPNLGFGMEEGRVIRWLRQPGDVIHKGDVLAEIESDKATVELEATVEGTLGVILVEAETLIPVGTVLARIQEGVTAAAPQPSSVIGEAVSKIEDEKEQQKDRRATPVAERYAQEHGIDLSTVTGTGRGGLITREDIAGALTAAVHANPAAHNGYVLAAPAVRKTARDQGIDLRAVTPTGRYGQVTRADLVNTRPANVISPPMAPIETLRQQAAEPSGSIQTVVHSREIPLTPMRKAIARRVAQSMQDIPHFYVTGAFDLTDPLQKLPAGVGVNALLLYLAVQTLSAHPPFNATYQDGHWLQGEKIDLSLAVALDTGLVAPTLPDAAQYSLTGLASHSRALIERARAGKMTSTDMQPGTFTISNLGVISQVDQFTAIINPPQVAILAVGAVKDRPVAINGGLHIRKTVHLTLSADHRLIDGLMAGRFLETFEARLRAFSP